MLISNDKQHAIPVREQNLDADGNIKVHAQGKVSVAPPVAVTDGGIGLGAGCGQTIDASSMQTATALSIRMDSDIQYIEFFAGSLAWEPAFFYGPAGDGPSTIVLALARPIAFDQTRCVGDRNFSVSTVGSDS